MNHRWNVFSVLREIYFSSLMSHLFAPHTQVYARHLFLHTFLPHINNHSPNFNEYLKVSLNLDNSVTEMVEIISPKQEVELHSSEMFFFSSTNKFDSTVLKFKRRKDTRKRIRPNRVQPYNYVPKVVVRILRRDIRRI